MSEKTYMSYGYDLAGNMTTQTYPSGRTVTTQYSSAGRADSLIGQMPGEGARTYVYPGINYWPHGATKIANLGNTRWEHWNYQSRLQLVEVGLGTSGSDSSLLKLTYNFSPPPNNNGNIWKQEIAVPGVTWTQTYTYDSLNRLLTAGENGNPSWFQRYGYDTENDHEGRYGNCWVVTPDSYIVPGSELLTPQSGTSFDYSTNRLTGGVIQYDNAGNLTADGAGRVFAYDAENRQKSYNDATEKYYYDGEGKRVKKEDSFGGRTVFVYNALGQLIAEYEDQLPPGSAETRYISMDHLGSTRVVTDSSGYVIARHDYLPFGEEIPVDRGGRSAVVDSPDNHHAYGWSDDTVRKFSGKERDSESGLDYFGARYFSGAQGRFTSPDPITVTPGRVTDPQQLNLYAYVRNNPLAYIDPTGMVIDTSMLSEDELEKWKRIQALASARDKQGGLLHPTLFAQLSALQADKRLFFIKIAELGGQAGGKFEITKFSDGDFTEATITLDFKKVGRAVPSKAELVPDFIKFEGLKTAYEKVAEVFGHESGHGTFALSDPAAAVRLQQQLNERDAAIAALPVKGRYPLPPDVMQKVLGAERALVPTETAAQQIEKIIHGELRASQKDRKR
jgi:RHS repeat-associated protein